MPVVTSVAQDVPLVVLGRGAGEVSGGVGGWTPARGRVVPVPAVGPLQPGAEAGRQVPDGPAHHHVVVEGQEQPHTDHRQPQTPGYGGHLTEYLDGAHPGILAQGYLTVSQLIR